MATHGPDLEHQLADLGVRPGDLVMVHASMRAVGPVDGGAAEMVRTLCQLLGPTGTLAAYVSWADSSYDATLNGRMLRESARQAWPVFDPKTMRPYPGFGILNQAIVDHPGAELSGNPDGCMAAIGDRAHWLVQNHPLDFGYGRGSPLEKIVDLGGKILLLGAPLDAVTILHYAEAIADIPGKRQVRYEVPLLDEHGRKSWRKITEWDTNGILDCYAADGQADAVEQITRDYVAEKEISPGRIGGAKCYLLDAREIVEFAVCWLESRHRD